MLEDELETKSVDENIEEESKLDETLCWNNESRIKDWETFY